MHIRYSMEVLIHQYVLILKQFMRHFMEVLSVMFCILSDIGSSSKEQTVDVTINPESCRPEVSKFFFFSTSPSAICGDFGYVVQDMLKIACNL